MDSQPYDVLILGSGPAGLQAAIHASRRKISVLVVGKIKKSSAYQAHIENYCCISGTTGEEMLKEGRKKAAGSGVEFLDQDVTDLRQEGHYFVADMESGQSIKAITIILAMGISRNKLKVKGETEYVGRGVSYCVDCDAGFFKGEPVAMVGCESAAVSGALTLLFYADQVHLICQELDVSSNLAEKLRESQIQVHEGKKISKINGNSGVEYITFEDGENLVVKGVFIELGAKGAIGLATKLGVALDTEYMKYIQVNKKQETNVEGVYAAGDICGPPWQMAKAVGEGCVAGLEAASMAKKKKSK